MKSIRLKTVFELALTVGLTIGALTGSGFYAIRGNGATPKSTRGKDPQALAASAEPWKFGVLSDTQWRMGDPDPANCPLGDTLSCDGRNPNGVAAGIINELNEQFISHGVKFVIQTGDLTDIDDPRALDTSATFRQELYDDWKPKFKAATAPAFEELHQRVKTGKETERVLSTCGQANYKEVLNQELSEMANSEMWLTGKAVRALRPKTKGVKIPTKTKGLGGRGGN